MNNVTASPSTLSSEILVYILFPLIVIAVASAVAWAHKIKEKQNEHGQALALILNDVAPAHGPSLRELVQAHAERLIKIETQLAVRQIPVTQLQPPEAHHDQ